MYKRIVVGGELDSYCGRCKLVLNHAITAMVDEAPKRVRCLTCQSEHNHRLPAARKTKAKKSTGTRTKRASSTMTGSNRWRQALAGWDGGTTKSYNIFDNFNVDDWISHGKFGNGLVIEVPGPDRIITLFESGEKMLMQGKRRS